MTGMKFLQYALLPWLMVANLATAQFSISDEYEFIGYEENAENNPVARLQLDLRSGKVTLEYSDKRGYLDSLLKALDIDPSSQMLVFSPTSLQHKLISPRSPRALYFNDNTYIGFVQNSSIVEVTTIDERFGIVFYTFDNALNTQRYFERANQTCLVCHDTQGTMGGGVPMLMALSSVYSERNVPLQNFSGIGNVVDQTPIRDRWGGWYVTGRHGLQSHLGNLRLPGAEALGNLNDYRIWNARTLDDIDVLDPEPYVGEASDIVALMVLEHQVTVQNQITYIKFKAPAVLKRRGLEEAASAPSWAALPEITRTTLTRMLDTLVAKMMFIDAAEFEDRISGLQAYQDDFLARGPFDTDGRTLRELDLANNLFEYPVSYLIYTDDFDTLPAYAKDYVYRKLAAVLSGAEVLEGQSRHSEAQKLAALEILAATKPEFTPYAEAVVPAETASRWRRLWR